MFNNCDKSFASIGRRGFFWDIFSTLITQLFLGPYGTLGCLVHFMSSVSFDAA